ncbi:MAG: hypothetical protein COB49_11740 [Alphaproteobacteria bacterium]|nr:MAG: hypothetical protein COB49_11740 [Alphaproteobacteria bacterium]
MSPSLNVISANGLRSGLNVYFIQDGGDNRWDRDISRASLFNEENLAAAFELAKEDMNNNVVVDCVIVPVNEKHIPLTAREQIRSTGPSTKYGHAINP